MSEPKYIDANELRAMMYHGAFEEDSGLQRWDGGCWIRYKMFENALEQIGAADVVEVVRCKDCKHADLFYPYCTIWEAAIDGDGYCYKGEKE